MEIQGPTIGDLQVWGGDGAAPQWGKGLVAFKTALMDRFTRRINICVIGDSVTEGFSSEDNISTMANMELQQNMWQHVVRRQLQRMFGGAGVGYVPAGTNRSPNTETPAQIQYTPLGWTQTGGDNSTSPLDHVGAAMKRMLLPGGSIGGTAGGLFVSAVPCDRILIYCSKKGTANGVGNGGAGIYYIDNPGTHLGGSGVAFNTFSAIAANPGGTTASTYTNLVADTGVLPVTANGQHRLDIGPAGTSDTVAFEGAFFCRGNFASGIGWWDFANGGTSTGMWTSADGVADANNNAVKSASWDRGITVADPDLVIIALGLNDFQGGGTIGRTPAQYGANLVEIARRVRAARTVTAIPPSILFVLPWAARDDVYTDANWQAYRVAARKAIASVADAGVVDLYNVMGRPSISPASYGWISSDHLHPLNKGHYVIAQAVLSYFQTEMLADVDVSQVFTAGVQNSLSHGSELSYVETTYASDASTVPSPAIVSGSQVNINASSGVRLVTPNFTSVGRAVDITIGMMLTFSAANMVGQVVLEDISSGGSAFIGTFDVVGPAIAGSVYYTFKRRFILGSETTPATPGTAAAPLLKQVGARMQALNAGASGTITVAGNLGAGSGQPTFIRVQDS